MNVGLDLDGVLADQTALKVRLFAKHFALSLERWQVSSNVIDSNVPDRSMRRSVGQLAGVSVLNDYTGPEVRSVLDDLRRDAKLMLLSTRGKTPDGMRAGLLTLCNLGLDGFFGNDIVFSRSDDEKVEAIVARACDVYVDDRIEVAMALVGRIPLSVLYDPFDLVSRGLVFCPTDVERIVSFSALPELTRGLRSIQ